MEIKSSKELKAEKEAKALRLIAMVAIGNFAVLGGMVLAAVLKDIGTAFLLVSLLLGLLGLAAMKDGQS